MIDCCCYCSWSPRAFFSEPHGEGLGPEPLWAGPCLWGCLPPAPSDFPLPGHVVSFSGGVRISELVILRAGKQKGLLSRGSLFPLPDLPSGD